MPAFQGTFRVSTIEVDRYGVIWGFLPVAKREKKYMPEWVGGSAIVGGGAEDRVDGVAGDGGGCRIRDVECKSMDSECRLKGGGDNLDFVGELEGRGDNLDFMGEGELERVSMHMQMRPGLAARDTNVEARRGRWGPGCTDEGWHAWEKGGAHQWGLGCID